MTELEELEIRERLQTALDAGDEVAELSAREDLDGAISPTVSVQQPESTPIKDNLIGVGETALSFATGSLVDPIAGAAGVASGIDAFIRGDESPLDAAVERIDGIRNQGTFTPKTEKGQKILETASIPFQKLGEFADAAGDRVQDTTGSAFNAAGIRSTIELLPALAGTRFKPNPVRVAKDVKQAKQNAESVGVNPSGNVAGQKLNILEEAVPQQTQGQVTKGQTLEVVQKAMIEAKDVAKQHVDSLYEAARDTSASIPVTQATQFNDIAKKSLESFDVDDMPIVKRRMMELEKIHREPENFSIRLERIDAWRRRLNKNRPPANDLAQNAALNTMKSSLDNFIDAQFNADMITGDAAAIGKWKDARAASRHFQEQFRDNRTIKQLTEKQATPEEIKSWLIGASSVGAKREAGLLVGKIKSVVGEDSPAMSAIRQEVVFDVMEPLMRESPDFKAFVGNYDKMVKNNPTLAKELFPDSQPHLKRLRNIASSINKVSPKKLVNIKLEEIAARATFGHGIAKAGMKVSLAAKAFNLLKGAATKSEKRKIMAEILGYDPSAPPLSVGFPLSGGAIQTGINEDQSDQ